MNTNTIVQPAFVVLEKGNVTSPRGFQAGGLHAGIKKKRKDIALLVSEVPAAAAGVFTTNQVRAACVTHNEKHLKQNPYLQAIIANSGTANACTGQQGQLDNQAMQAHTAAALGLPQNAVATASTGVIGVQMPMDTLQAGITDVAQQLSVA